MSGETVCEISQQRLKQWLSPRVPAIPFTRTPSELECSQSNGALCFINPLFLQTHQTNPSPKKQESSPGNTDHQNREDSVFCRAQSTQFKSHSSVSRSNSKRSPPPRPPPPRFASGRSAVLRKQKTMPETVCWIKTPQEKSSLLWRLGSSFSSLSPSSSPPKSSVNPSWCPHPAVGIPPVCSMQTVSAATWPWMTRPLRKPCLGAWPSCPHATPPL